MKFLWWRNWEEYKDLKIFHTFMTMWKKSIIVKYEKDICLCKVWRLRNQSFGEVTNFTRRVFELSILWWKCIRKKWHIDEKSIFRTDSDPFIISINLIKKSCPMTRSSHRMTRSPVHEFQRIFHTTIMKRIDRESCDKGHDQDFGNIVELNILADTDPNYWKKIRDMI